MHTFKNTLEIFKLLERSNCRECGRQSCMAFAADVFAGEKKLGDCSHLDREVIEKHGAFETEQISFESLFMEKMSGLKEIISSIDLSQAEGRTGGTFVNNKLTLKILGKDFAVDNNGNITTDIHINGWIVGPVFSYIFSAKDTPLSGRWINFREMNGGMERYGLFNQRCEKTIKKVADNYTDFFEDMVRLFNGKEIEKQFKSDISLVLHPLPKIPILICYWKEDDGLESDLKLFFDSASEEHLKSEIIADMATGLAVMFKKISKRLEH